MMDKSKRKKPKILFVAEIICMDCRWHLVRQDDFKTYICPKCKYETTVKKELRKLLKG